MFPAIEHDSFCTYCIDVYRCTYDMTLISTQTLSAIIHVHSNFWNAINTYASIKHTSHIQPPLHDTAEAQKFPKVALCRCTEMLSISLWDIPKHRTLLESPDVKRF